MSPKTNYLEEDDDSEVLEVSEETPKAVIDRRSIRGAEKAIVENSQPDIIKLSTGVKLRAKRVSPMLINGATKQFKRPDPPTVYNSDTGRSEENPNDPDYLSRVGQWEASMSTAVINVMIVFGTELVSVPKNYPRYDDPDLIESLQAVGIFAQTQKQMYLNWVKYHAAVDPNDIQSISQIVGRLSGVAEEDVDEAVDGFRRSV